MRAASKVNVGLSWCYDRRYKGAKQCPKQKWSNMHFTPTITAVLGGTNTGKTHYAVERMLARSSGVIGLPLDDHMIARIENNAFMPERYAEWRSTSLDFSSVEALKHSLATPPKLKGLRRIAPAADETALSRLCDSHDIEDNIRTWTYIAHKPGWALNAKNGEKDWVKLAQTVEHRLSDALHSKLVDRFVDKRTSILLKGIEEKTNMNATVTSEGQVVCAGQILGTLYGLLFTPVETKSELEANAIKQTANQSLTAEIDRRLMQIAGSGQGALTLSDQGEFMWNDAPIGKLVVGDSMLTPKVELLCGELGSQVLRGSAVGRLADYIRLEITQKLGCIFALRDFAESPTSYKDARALAHIMFENYGSLDGRIHYNFVKDVGKPARGYIVGLGGAFGSYYTYMRDLMKPAPARLLSILYAYAWIPPKDAISKDAISKGAISKDARPNETQGGQPFFPSNGMTSLPAIGGYSEDVLNMAGYTRRGPRIVRFDILNRLAKMLFQVRKERKDGRFAIKKEMLSLMGSSFEDFEKILKALNYRKTTQKFTDEEAKAHQDYVQAYFARRDAILKAKELGALNPDDFPPILQDKPEPTTDKNHPDYLSKRKRERIIILNDFVAKPQEDEDGNPIFQTELELWAHGRAVKPPSRYRPSKHGSNDPDKAGGTGAGKSPYTDTYMGEKATVMQKSARRSRMSGYEKFASATKSAAGGSSKPRRQNKRRKPSGNPVQTTWAPPKQAGAPPSASPFAALAGLSFDEPKSDKRADKKPGKKIGKAKPKTKAKAKPKPKPKDQKS